MGAGYEKNSFGSTTLVIWVRANTTTKIRRKKYHVGQMKFLDVSVEVVFVSYRYIVYRCTVTGGFLSVGKSHCHAV
jgi:polyisoprenoid-binding protein YceI